MDNIQNQFDPEMKTEELSFQNHGSIRENMDGQTSFGIKCKYKNPASVFCINQNCESQLIFICPNVKCPCNNEHKKCIKVNIDYAYEELKNRIIDTSSINQMIEKVFEAAIDELSELRDNILTNANKNLKYASISNVGREFLKIIQSEIDQSNFSSKDAKIVWETINNNFDSNEFFLKLQNTIDDFYIDHHKNMYFMADPYNKILQNYGINIQQRVILDQKIANSIFQDNCSHMLAQSSILKTTEQIEKLFGFFPDQILGIKLLFKASENHFQFSKYIQKHGKEENVLLILKTNKYKIIGGYTPLSFEFTGQGRLNSRGDEWISDEENKTFVFSLTNNDKFQLKEKKDSICRFKKKNGIQFGTQICLCNSADTRQCEHLINGLFYNENYKLHDENSYIRFNGNSGPKFKTSEWEIWKVQT